MADPLKIGSSSNESSQDAAKLQRSESSSSSVTIHPLNNNDDQKGSSSSSSSPTYQSISSSAHKTNSTIASSLQTGGSRSPIQGDAKVFYDASSETVAADASKTEVQKGRSSASPSGNASNRRSRILPDDSRWDQRRYQEIEEDSYSIHDEEAPIQYPPFSDEEREARKIEQKLEQWTAEEKMRRKAKRSSRTVSIIVTPSTNRLSRRLSVLGVLASSGGKHAQPTYPEPVHSTTGAHDEAGTENGRNMYSKHAGVAGSTDALVDNERAVNGSSRWTRDTSSSGLEDVAESYDDDDQSIGSTGTLTKGKGKSREVSDPFQDPKPRIKPTPRNPIVTPGRAPTIRHRALERARQDGTSMPAIVATDADEENEANAALEKFQRLDDDPFQHASERPSMRTTGSTYTIGSTVDEHGGERGVPKRKSTNSRFNEIGLDDDEDASGWPADDSLDDHKTRSTSADATPRAKPQMYAYSDASDRFSHRALSSKVEQEPPPRGPWWTEWLCGCGAPSDADLEQSGRTFPE